LFLQALTKGYQVRCLVQTFESKFFKRMGVELVYGDLSRSETIPKGITAIIDASTNVQMNWTSLKVDWDGKLVLIEAAKAANIKRFIFFSAQNVEQFENIPINEIKIWKLKQNNPKFHNFSLTGFTKV
jgi:nucleoside-diphosphate-sugar epimerase